MSRLWNTIVVGVLATVGLAAIHAQPIPIPNGSFETPATPFVTTFIDGWQETPKPDDYVEGAGFTWDQLTGIFVNTPPGDGDHIDNCDGAQVAYFFAVPEVGWFQDHDSVDWNDAAPSHAFDARFEAGKAYELSFGVIAGGGNMLEGVSFEAALYYRDASSNQVAVAATNIVFNREMFPNRTHLTSFRVQLPTVKMDEPWAGQHIGVRFLSNVSSELQGGYWDLDDVRLSATTAEAPAFAVRTMLDDSDLRLAWDSAVGFQYQMRVSEDLLVWDDLGAPLAGTGGELVQRVPLAARQHASFSVRATPNSP